MDSTLNFPPLTGTHDATRKANLPSAVHLGVVPSQTEKQDTPRQIIMKFTSRIDRDSVWAEKEKIKKCKEFSGCFFVTDLPWKVAQEWAQLRRIEKRARDIHKIKAEVRNDKLVLVESNLRYKLEEIPECLKSGENKLSAG